MRTQSTERPDQLHIFRDARIRRLLAENRSPIAWSILATSARSVLAVLVPYYFGRSVEVIAHGAGRNEVWEKVGLLLGTAVATGFCQYWMRWLYIGMSRQVEYRLRNELFEHLERLSFSFFNRSRTGDIMSRLTADIEAVRMGIGPGAMHLFQSGLMAVGALVSMLTVSWKLTLFAMVPMGLMLLICRRLMPRLHDASEIVQTQLGKLSALAQESFSGARVVQAFAREDYEVSRFRTDARKYIADSMRLSTIRARFHVVTEVMTGLVIVALVWFGGRLVVEGRISIGHFAAFHGYFLMLVWPMIGIGWTLSLFQRGVVALKRLNEFFDVAPEIDGGTHAPKEIRGEWRFDGLDFAHAGGKKILDGIDLEIPAGSSIAIVGPTGCGKSTLVQLLGRLFDPPPGMLFLDGVDVRNYDLGVLRRSIAMVPQETFLFSDTISSNIAYAESDVSEEAIVAAAEAAQVKDAILAFPNGFQEVIGERGVTLSGGQKQRVAIARALIHSAPTMVLDDCLSAVDTETEERIIEHLKRLMTGRTTVVVAHRLSSVMHCDQIVVLRDGRIAERGTHSQLLERGGWYADTFKRQLIGRELEAAT